MLKTAREKVLAMVLPAVAISGIYALKVSDVHKRWTGAETALAAAKGRVPAAAQVSAELGRIGELNRQMAEVQKQTGEEDARWHELENSRKNDSLARIQAIEGVTTLLNRHGLGMLDGSPAESSDTAKLPKSLEQVVKLLGDKQNEFKPQIWRVRFIGRYSDVLLALEELQEAEPLAIPIHLQMAEARLGTTTRSWTLYLWI